MKLTITLSPTEEANLRAWERWLRTHPEYIGVTSGDWNDGQATYQSRIVLEEQTAARYEEIAAQLMPPLPVCPVGTEYITHSWGDSRRVELPTFSLTPTVVTLAVPDDAPTSRTLGTIRLYEYSGDPSRKQLVIGKHACDFRDALDPLGETGPMVNVGGMTASVGFGVAFGGSEDARLQAGGTYYLSMRSLVAGTWPAAYEIQWPR